MLRSKTVFIATGLAIALLAPACGDDKGSSDTTTTAGATTTSAASTTVAQTSATTAAASTTTGAEATTTGAPATSADVSHVGDGKTIKIGGIFARTTTQDLALGAYEAADAFFKNLNDQGGVNGYKFSFEGIDDQGDPAKFAAGVERLINDGVDFIISTSATTITGGLAQIQSSGIPYIGGGGYGRQAFETPNIFPVAPNFQKSSAKVLITLLTQKTPPIDAVTYAHVNSPALDIVNKMYNSDLSAAGIKIDDGGTWEYTDTDFTGVAAKIISAGNDNAIVIPLTSQAPSIVGALEQQGYEGTIYSSAYDAAMPGKMGSYANGRFYTAIPYGVLGAGQAGDDATAIVKKYYPDIDITSQRNSMQMWTAGEIVVEAIKRLGATPISKESIIATLNTFQDFAPTFMAPITYSAGADGHLDVSHCIQALKIEDEKWTLAGPDRFTCWEGSVAPD